MGRVNPRLGRKQHPCSRGPRVTALTVTEAAHPASQPWERLWGQVTAALGHSQRGLDTCLGERGTGCYRE